MKVQRAKGCAWRALYLSAGKVEQTFTRQLARIVLDPTISTVGPALRVALSVGSHTHRELRAEWRIPYVRFAWAFRWQRFGAFRLYIISTKILHKLDGRYGWGTAR